MSKDFRVFIEIDGMDALVREMKISMAKKGRDRGS